MIAIAVVYTVIAVSAFCRYKHERTINRIALSLLAPLVLVLVVMEWLVSQLEDLG